jgi:CDP-glucose 4,6-dehydratase
MLLAEHVHRNPELHGASFNFSNELQVNVLQLVHMILQKTNSHLEPDILNEASHEIRHQWLSAERVRKQLGWSPLFTLDEGLDRTIEWYKEFLR